MNAHSFDRLITFTIIALVIAAILLVAPGTAGASAPAAQTAQSACTYRVQHGDTLFGIAARYHISAWELMRLNNMYYMGWVYAGQTLRVPCGGNSDNSGCTYRASYVADVTVSDGTYLIAGAPFNKVWRVRNTGTCMWGPGHALHSMAWVGGTRMGAPASVEIKNIIYPNSQVDLSVPMVAPSLAGRYLSEWKLKVDGGSLIGVGASGRALYVDFNVAGPWYANPVRIQFAPGTNSQIANGVSDHGQTVRYVLSARGGQTMTVALVGIAPTPAGIAISGARDQELLLPGMYGRTSWSGMLPTTQDYYIDVTPNNNQPLNFALQVTIN